MRVVIDISVFSDESGSYGVVSGPLDVEIVPVVGDVVSFSGAKAGTLFPSGTSFRGALRVTDRVVPANEGQGDVLVCLEDLKLRTDADASDCMSYFQNGFGLGFDPSHG